ncbi:MAG: hypothetical protein IJS65_08275, partial [Clostridia bacterium]|nr:hypothetical protein [Clostridia bacterium]
IGESWEGCDAISAQWTDARGGKSVIEISPFARGGKSVIEISPFAREVVFPVSFAAKKYAGDVYLTLKGGRLASGGEALLSATLSASARFTVGESLWDGESETADMPDPTVAEQLTGRITEVENGLSSHAGRTDNPHNVTQSQVGLGNVNNTSDLNKPISTATQTALNGKFDKTGGTIEGTVSVKKTSGDMLVLNRTDTATGIVTVNAESGSKLTLSSDDDDVTVRGVETPAEDNDAANKEYVDDQRDAAKGYAETQAAEAENNAKEYADGKFVPLSSSSDLSVSSDGGIAIDADGNALFEGENVSISASGSAESTVNLGANNVVLEVTDFKLSVGSGDAEGIPAGISANGNNIHGVGTPLADTDAANKGYIDAAILALLPKKTVAGNPISISDGANGVPLVSCTADVSATVTRTGKNLTTPQTIYANAEVHNVTTLEGRSVIRIVDIPVSGGGTVTPFKFKSNTRYTISFTATARWRNTDHTTQGSNSHFLFIKYTDNSEDYIYAPRTEDTAWTSYSFTTDANKTISKVGVTSIGRYLYYYIDLSTFQFEEGATETAYEAYAGQTATAGDDGSVTGLTTLPGYNYIYTSGTNLSVTYKQDLAKAIEALEA